VNTFEASAVFVLAVVAFSTGPLTATPTATAPPRRPRPSWAHSPAQARRIARATRHTTPERP
jgi:hypothetical protein